MRDSRFLLDWRYLEVLQQDCYSKFKHPSNPRCIISASDFIRPCSKLLSQHPCRTCQTFEVKQRLDEVEKACAGKKIGEGTTGWLQGLQGWILWLYIYIYIHIYVSQSLQIEEASHDSWLNIHENARWPNDSYVCWCWFQRRFSHCSSLPRTSRWQPTQKSIPAMISHDWNEGWA